MKLIARRWEAAFPPTVSVSLCFFRIPVTTRGPAWEAVACTMSKLGTSPVRQRAPVALPVIYGRLLDFPDDPHACMRRVYREHGLVGAIEDGGERLYFAFGPEYNHQL